jgi:hypothetical protein
MGRRFKQRWADFNKTKTRETRRINPRCYASTIETHPQWWEKGKLGNFKLLLQTRLRPSVGGEVSRGKNRPADLKTLDRHRGLQVEPRHSLVEPGTSSPAVRMGYGRWVGKIQASTH